MEQIVITIHPSPSDDGLLRVSDAMQQVIDAIKLFEAAERAIASPLESFDWRLQKASTNSPFSVIAVAEARDRTVDVAPHVRKVKEAVSTGLRGLTSSGELPWWMGVEEIQTARLLFERTLNGISNTSIDVAANDTFLIDRTIAGAGINAISGITAIDVESSLSERVAYGEIVGLMVAAGRYRGQPAIQIRDELYGFIWCPLAKALIAEFGDEHKMADVWDGKALGVLGRLIYGKGGRLSRIEADAIREVGAAASIDLESVLDPGFTAGLDPVDYLDRFREGRLD